MTQLDSTKAKTLYASHALILSAALRDIRLTGESLQKAGVGNNDRTFPGNIFYDGRFHLGNSTFLGSVLETLREKGLLSGDRITLEGRDALKLHYLITGEKE